MTESEPGGSSSTSGTPPGPQENPNMSLLWNTHLAVGLQDNSTNTLVTAQVLEELVEMEDRKKRIDRLVDHDAPEKRKRSQEQAAGAKKKKEDSEIGILYEFLASATQKIQSAKCEREHLDTNDCDVMFLLCLRDNIKNLGAQKKALAKIRIQQILFDLEFPDT
ncbi:hypothetical protein IscW_ISCW018828 [Ixodes scapularis]|uniref:BESS domain-containing protein n=1 Tax=Ixodes scapularis TaxID=6945 RepID=B7PKF2_IXOSC|nr:hypothetical protein IscW_ISCW018828 [Ixodes scapularis]|eukprot:XP_002399777.1 hypothetical protein IscW_ISCW018828 [Ixodes scapularis]